MIPNDIIKECLRALTGRVRQCSLHAFEHLDKAALIAELDPEMAMFRAITAEEEAATALFVALKQRGYDRAKDLQIRNHVHKQAAFPFIAIVHDYLGTLKPQPPMGWERVEKDGTPRLTWKFQVPDGRWASPSPPLHSVLWRGETGEAYHFEDELRKFAEDTGTGSIKRHLAERANLRNQLLYATDRGIPRATGGVEEALEEQRTSVRIINILTCMIAPYREKGAFAQQCLNSFLYFLDKINADELHAIDYGVEAPASVDP